MLRRKIPAVLAAALLAAGAAGCGDEAEAPVDEEVVEETAPIDEQDPLPDEPVEEHLDEGDPLPDEPVEETADEE